MFPRSSERGSIEAKDVSGVNHLVRSFHVRVNVAPLKRPNGVHERLFDQGFHVRVNVAPLKPLPATMGRAVTVRFHVRVNVAPLKRGSRLRGTRLRGVSTFE